MGDSLLWYLFIEGSDWSSNQEVWYFPHHAGARWEELSYVCHRFSSS